MTKIQAEKRVVRDDVAVLLTRYRTEVAALDGIADRRLAAVRRAGIHAVEMAEANLLLARRARRQDRADLWTGLARHWHAVAAALATADDGFQAAA